MPKAYIFAGANASGKSTFISFLLENKLIEGYYINPDIILKEELKLTETIENYKKAFEIAKKRREIALKYEKDIILETVFSTEEKVNFVKELKKNGYYITFVFTGTESAKINAVYLVNRVEQGGHDVPITKLISRRERGFKNLKKIKDIVDCLILIDNSLINKPPQIVAGFYKNQLCVVGKEVKWLQETGIEINKKHLISDNINNEAFIFCQTIQKNIYKFSEMLEKSYNDKNKILVNANKIEMQDKIIKPVNKAKKNIKKG